MGPPTQFGVGDFAFCTRRSDLIFLAAFRCRKWEYSCGAGVANEFVDEQTRFVTTNKIRHGEQLCCKKIRNPYCGCRPRILPGTKLDNILELCYH